MANSTDPDQMMHSAVSYLGLHCLAFVSQYLRLLRQVNGLVQTALRNKFVQLFWVNIVNSNADITYMK